MLSQKHPSHNACENNLESQILREHLFPIRNNVSRCLQTCPACADRNRKLTNGKHSAVAEERAAGVGEEVAVREASAAAEIKSEETAVGMAASAVAVLETTEG